MELLTVSLMSGSSDELLRLAGSLQEALGNLHRRLGGVPIAEWSIRPEGSEISCKALLPQFKLGEHGEAIYGESADVLTDYIMDVYEPVLIRSIIRKQLSCQNSEELAAVEACCRQILSGTHWDLYIDAESGEGHSPFEDIKRRKHKIAEELKQYMEENQYLNLHGIVTFRLHAYWNELREAAEFAMEEYIMDKQYRDFVALLKYFVSAQEAKIGRVHLLHREGYEFQLMDEYFNPLETRPGERIVAEIADVEMNMEDMIVSTLLSVAPGQVVIHTRHPELQVIRTIETIFENRISVCMGCASCKQSLERG
ncbi:putative sporulation protein YtxC [Paenibacillus beijingensis]|uniref:Sporulation protein n=1 Tax=Paenibacillus beijingensis TaxID=1126833 RepID=A0A0D5NKF0_9BACL|nr:putative sporulation protein YtxC [Paenibacillus beijingensis]AJY75824.1 hypothetical protein VN24_16265 [Paenibacillus beijingensis]